MAPQISVILFLDILVHKTLLPALLDGRVKGFKSDSIVLRSIQTFSGTSIFESRVVVAADHGDEIMSNCRVLALSRLLIQALSRRYVEPGSRRRDFAHVELLSIIVFSLKQPLFEAVPLDLLIATTILCTVRVLCFLRTGFDLRVRL